MSTSSAALASRFFRPGSNGWDARWRAAFAVASLTAFALLMGAFVSTVQDVNRRGIAMRLAQRQGLPTNVAAFDSAHADADSAPTAQLTR